jgi:hypothetical protein
MSPLEDLALQDQMEANTLALIVARSAPSKAPTASLSAVPTGAPTASPPVQPGEPIQVRMGDFYMSYVSTKTEEPTADEYNQLVALNEEHFGAQFTTHFETNPDIEFIDIQLKLRKTSHGTNAGIPEPKFNIYMVRTRSHSCICSARLVSRIDMLIVVTLVTFLFFFRNTKTPYSHFRGRQKTSPTRMNFLLSTQMRSLLNIS